MDIPPFSVVRAIGYTSTMGSVLLGSDGPLYPLGSSNTIGRRETSPVPCPDRPGISRDHLILSWERVGWTVCPLGRNGTFLNGRALKFNDRIVVQPGDRIGLGADKSDLIIQ